MIKTCGNCVYMLDDGDGSKPYCALQDLYTDVELTPAANGGRAKLKTNNGITN